MQVEIEKLTYGGAGIGSYNGKKVFVNGGLPGDVAEIEIITEKKNFCIAKIKKIISPSSHRIQPLCKIFETCGGCQWQDLDYKTQIKEKENILAETLIRIGKFREINLLPMDPSPSVYGYRTRLTLTTVKKKTHYKPAFFKKGTKNKIAINFCPIATEQVNQGIDNLKRYLRLLGSKGNLIHKVYIAAGDKNFGITLEMRKKQKMEKKGLSLFDLKLCDNEKQLDFSMGEMLFTFVPSVFIQANKDINLKMVNFLKQKIGKHKNGNTKTILDLYCGIGNFSLPLAKLSSSVVGVDSNHLSIKHAKINAELNHINNSTFIHSPVETFLENNNTSYDIVILDPPRDGAKNIIKHLSKIRPKRIFYISCNPATLSRDLYQLVLSGYSLLSVKPFDMFPQTYHIECIAELGI